MPAKMTKNSQPKMQKRAIRRTMKETSTENTSATELTASAASSSSTERMDLL